jgi:inosine-uridine nucleoside N-ribohydrolase
MLTNEQIIQKLAIPGGRLNIVIDTDTYNEVDDQFALVYALRSQNRLNVEAIYAAPFFNKRSESPGDGMRKSYDEIINILDKMSYKTPSGFVKKGSGRYLESLDTPCQSEAVQDLIERAMAAKDTLYVVAIGAVTNVASALLLEPKIAEKIVVLWLGGHAFHWPDTFEFNLKQDTLSANVVFDSNVPLVLFPCKGVVSHFSTTLPELKANISENSAIGRYLINIVEDYSFGRSVYSKVIWDAVTIAYLNNEAWTSSRIVPSPIAGEDFKWRFDKSRHPIKYIWSIDRDAIYADLFDKINKQ